EPDPAPAPGLVEEQVRGDPVQPALEGAGCVAVERAEHPDEDLLREVLGVVQVAGQPVGEAIDARGVVGDDLFPAGRDPGLARSTGQLLVRLVVHVDLLPSGGGAGPARHRPERRAFCHRLNLTSITLGTTPESALCVAPHSACERTPKTGCSPSPACTGCSSLSGRLSRSSSPFVSVQVPETQEAVIAAGIKPASWSYAEEFVAEDEVLGNAR